MVAVSKAVSPNKINLAYGHTDAKEQQNNIAVTAQGNVKKLSYFEATVDFASAADGVGETVQLTGCNGVSLGDAVIAVSLGLDLQDMILTAYVQADTVIELRLQNESTGTVNLASTTVRVVVADVT